MLRSSLCSAAILRQPLAQNDENAILRDKRGYFVVPCPKCACNSDAPYPDSNRIGPQRDHPSQHDLATTRRAIGKFALPRNPAAHPYKTSRSPSMEERLENDTCHVQNNDAALGSTTRYSKVMLKENSAVSPGAITVMLRLCSNTSSSVVRVACPVQGSSATNGASPVDHTPM